MRYMNWQPISKHISDVTGKPFSAVSADPLTGGDINAAYRLQGDGVSYFVKLNRAENVDMFAAEAAGLKDLAATLTVRVPAPVDYGSSDQNAYLVLEFIEFGGASKSSDQTLGHQLAQLHQLKQEYFGWHRNNTIGSTPQNNTRHDNWPGFWREQRLHFQLQLAAKKGYRGHLQTTGEQLCSKLDGFFGGYQPQPSLLHGDLWGGNAATDTAGNPVIFDPACYYGDREADLAMTELFGGFSRDFYAAYQACFPLDSGYATRKKLYNLYHILNHLNLFGSSYLRQAEDIISELLCELG
jgi:protein-ribulosamine 3-kinase